MRLKNIGKKAVTFVVFSAIALFSTYFLAGCNSKKDSFSNKKVYTETINKSYSSSSSSAKMLKFLQKSKDGRIDDLRPKNYKSLSEAGRKKVDSIIVDYISRNDSILNKFNQKMFSVASSFKSDYDLSASSEFIVSEFRKFYVYSLSPADSIYFVKNNSILLGSKNDAYLQADPLLNISKYPFLLNDLKSALCNIGLRVDSTESMLNMYRPFQEMESLREGALITSEVMFLRDIAIASLN